MADTSNQNQEPDFLKVKKGLVSWIFSADHKRIGLLYLYSLMAMLKIYAKGADY